MHSPYRTLATTISINAVIMFLLTYAMIDQFDHFYPNINRAYMALIMVAPMVALMLVMMGGKHGMYSNIRLNTVLFAVATLVFVGAFGLARYQGLVGNKQFLRSMIPHHSSAIVMCENPSITDPEIVKLCGEIVDAQKREIEQMQNILRRY